MRQRKRRRTSRQGQRPKQEINRLREVHGTEAEQEHAEGHGAWVAGRGAVNVEQGRPRVDVPRDQQDVSIGALALRGVWCRR